MIKFGLISRKMIYMNIQDRELEHKIITDEPQIITLQISSYIGLDPQAKHSYGTLYYDGGKIELTRRVYRWELDEEDIWGWSLTDIVYKSRTNGFMTKESVIKYTRGFIKKWFIGDWTLEIEN